MTVHAFALLLERPTRFPWTAVHGVHCTTPRGTVQRADSMNDASWSSASRWQPLWAGAYPEMSVPVAASLLGSAYICRRRLVWETASVKVIVSPRVGQATECDCAQDGGAQLFPCCARVCARASVGRDEYFLTGLPGYICVQGQRGICV